MSDYRKCARFLLSLALVHPFVTPASGVAEQDPIQAAEADTESLVQKLQSGGYLVYIRHAATDRTQVDQDRNDLSDCITQRNLSEAGREQARALGEAMRALKIPVGKVFASPYCRCQDTAQLAFGKAQVSEDLRFGLGDDMQQTERLSQALKAMLSTAPNNGTNTVLVSHSANLKEATGIWPQPEGAAYIFKPLPDMEFEYLGNIPPEAWALQDSAPSVSTYSLK